MISLSSSVARSWWVRAISSSVRRLSGSWSLVLLRAASTAAGAQGRSPAGSREGRGAGFQRERAARRARPLRDRRDRGHHHDAGRPARHHRQQLRQRLARSRRWCSGRRRASRAASPPSRRPRTSPSTCSAPTSARWPSASPAPGDGFAEVDFTAGIGDAPLLDGCAARFECRHAAGYDGGDHLIVVGEVLRLPQADLPPLLYPPRRATAGSPAR